MTDDAEMNAVVEERYKKILAMPAGKAHMAEVAAETKLLKEEQALLIQWAEEKVQLAGTGYEILETYAHNLEGDIGNLAQYLTETGQLVDDYMGDEYGMSADPNMYDSAPPKRSASRQLGYTSSMDGFESVPPLETKPPRTCTCVYARVQVFHAHLFMRHACIHGVSNGRVGFTHYFMYICSDDTKNTDSIDNLKTAIWVWAS